MDLSSTVRSELEAEKVNLGAAEAPEGVEARTAAQIERAVDESLVAVLRAVMLVLPGSHWQARWSRRSWSAIGASSPRVEIPVCRTGVGRTAPVLRSFSYIA
jgi:hypothetical protein